MRKVMYENDEIKIDNGLFFGKGVFETILVNKKPVFLEEHVKRLNNAIEALNIGEKIEIEEVRSFIIKNKIVNKSFKIAVTEENLIFNIRNLKYTKDHYENGFKAYFSKVLRNSTSRIVNFKTLNYLENIIEYELCQRNGFNEAIFVNEKGFVCEGCTTNIFMIKDKQIYTPKIECGLLPGIIRDWIIENFNVIEKNLTKDDILNSDEVFFTNSLGGVIKCTEIENKIFKSKIIEEIKKQYDEAINGGK